MRRAPALLLLLAAVSLIGQQRPELRETVEVRLIEVDAVVTDREGNPVTGLRPDDFELFENGRRQTITNFSEYRESHPAEGGTPAETRDGSVSIPEPRTIVLFVDRLLLRSSRRETLFDQLRTLIEQTMRDGDRAQVLVWDDMTGVRPATPMTGSRDAVIEAVAAIEKKLDAPTGGVSADEREQFFREVAEAAASRGTAIDAEAETEASLRQAAEEVLLVMRRKTAAMQRILSSLAEQPGRTAFIYVSDSFPMVAGKRSFGPDPPLLSTKPMLDTVIRSANAHGIVFYALRPDLPWTSGIGTLSQDRLRFDDVRRPADAATDHAILQNDVEALTHVALATGGSVATGPEGIERAVQRIARDLGSYYSFAYRARADGSDRERRIEIRPKNRAHTVRARRTVVDRSDRSRARDLLIARLFEKTVTDDIPFEVALHPPKPAPRNRVLIPVELSIPAGQLQFEETVDELVARFSVLVVAGANIGQITEVSEETRIVTAPLGKKPDGLITYRLELLADRRQSTVSIVVHDETSGLAGAQSVTIDGGVASVDVPDAPGADGTWQSALQRAGREQKPLLIWFRPQRCRACASFEREVIEHPAIQRRLSQMVFASLPARQGQASQQWASSDGGFGFFDHAGSLRVRWVGTPDAATFGAILDGVIAAAPYFAAAVELGDEGGELRAAIGLAMLGRTEDARAALARGLNSGSVESRQRAVITGAILDAREGKLALAIEDLDRLIEEAVTPDVAGEAWLTIGSLHRHAGANREAVHALNNAIRVATAGSPVARAAEELLAATTGASESAGVITILPPDEQLVSGRVRIRTTVSTAAVERVSFLLNGDLVREVTDPPFSTPVDFGRFPEQQTIRVVARDAAGREIGSDELVVNHGGETFWVRLLEPREGPAGGAVAVSARLRVPPARAIRRLVITWNDRERAELRAEPWTARVDIPDGEVGVLRAVAELDDGRTTEDAVLLNARGAVEHSSVQLVEIPITIITRGNTVPAVAPADLIVREREQRRIVETLSADAPLTVGLVIDASGSMQKTIPDVQEAAIRFLETTLRERDRAFIVAFNTRAALIQPPTSDVTLLREQILKIRPTGLTALYDAIAVGLLQFEGVKGRRALIVFTDGADRTSRYTGQAVAELSKRMHVPVHLIGARAQRLDVASQPYRELAMLGRIADATGGRAHVLHDLSELETVYAEIESAIRAQLVAFIRTDPGSREGEWRPIRVELDASGARVRAPEGYYAPW